MLADADEIDFNLIGKNRLFDQVADHLRGMQRFSIRTIGNVTEGIQTEFDVLIHAGLLAVLDDERGPIDTSCSQRALSCLRRSRREGSRPILPARARNPP